jgi:hypothetical protein
MKGELYDFFERDHRRLEVLLEKATAPESGFDMDAYREFRQGLLRHIRMEETILLPTAMKIRNGEPLAIAAKIRLDHGALTALMVPPPSKMIVAAVKGILADHDLLEEGPGGMYESIESLSGTQATEMLQKAKSTPEVRLQPNQPGDNILDATRRAVARAGYNLDDYS